MQARNKGFVLMKRTSSIREYRIDRRIVSESGRFVVNYCGRCRHEAKCPVLAIALLDGLDVIADKCDRFALKHGKNN
jgi:hypothetical protein